MIKAKFKCHSVTILENAQELTLSPVYGQDETDNANWSRFTPSGCLKMVVTNPDAYNQIEVGKEYFLTIEECLK